MKILKLRRKQKSFLMKSVCLKKTGFTIIELMVVILIIGILATVVIIAVNRARNLAKDASVKNDLRQARILLENYKINKGNFAQMGFCANTECNDTTIRFPIGAPTQTWADYGEDADQSKHALVKIGEDIFKNVGDRGLYLTTVYPHQDAVLIAALPSKKGSDTNSGIWLCYDTKGNIKEYIGWEIGSTTDARDMAWNNGYCK